LYILYLVNDKSEEISKELDAYNVSEMVYRCAFNLKNILFCYYNEYIYSFKVVEEDVKVEIDSRYTEITTADLVVEMLGRLNGGNKIKEFRDHALIVLGKLNSGEQTTVARKLGLTPRSLHYYLTEEIRELGGYSRRNYGN
jgi:hypothetical protein